MPNSIQAKVPGLKPHSGLFKQKEIYWKFLGDSQNLGRAIEPEPVRMLLKQQRERWILPHQAGRTLCAGAHLRCLRRTQGSTTLLPADTLSLQQCPPLIAHFSPKSWFDARASAELGPRARSPAARSLGNAGVRMSEGEPTCRICHGFPLPYNFIVRL